MLGTLPPGRAEVLNGPGIGRAWGRSHLGEMRGPPYASSASFASAACRSAIRSALVLLIGFFGGRGVVPKNFPIVVGCTPSCSLISTLLRPASRSRTASSCENVGGVTDGGRGNPARSTASAHEPNRVRTVHELGHTPLVLRQWLNPGGRPSCWAAHSLIESRISSSDHCLIPLSLRTRSISAGSPPGGFLIFIPQDRRHVVAAHEQPGALVC